MSFKESHERPFNENQDDVYHTTPEDNDVALSREDRQFLKIAEEGIHENALGNWEMPLPFRTEDVVMPNNREQALNRFSGLLRTFKRKPRNAKRLPGIYVQHDRSWPRRGRALLKNQWSH